MPRKMPPTIKKVVDITLKTFIYILTQRNADAWPQYRDCVLEQLKTGQTLLQLSKQFPAEELEAVSAKLKIILRCRPAAVLLNKT